MQKRWRLFFYIILVLLSFNIHGTQEGIIQVPCGNNNIKLNYKISANYSHTNKFVILIDGSPLKKFFSENTNNYLYIYNELLKSGYKIFEIKYSYTNGFYDACLNQGINNINTHAATIYDHALALMNYDLDNKNNHISALGFSIGAVLIQGMAFSAGKEFHRVALTGVLLGDAQRGCEEGLNLLQQLSFVEENRENNFNDPAFHQGFSWASFMNLVQKVSISGQGCCIENSLSPFGCKEGSHNEYSAALNFEKQPFYHTSNIGLFEGAITYRPPSLFRTFSVANPGQAKYIVEQREEAGAPTQLFLYPECGHSIINCSQKSAYDIINFLKNS
jgi:hypothetical protein